jgi:hypothetical protein
MSYMAQQALTTAIRDAFADRPDVDEQLAEADRCLSWLSTLPIAPALLAPVLEPVDAVALGLRDAARARARRSTGAEGGAA